MYFYDAKQNPMDVMRPLVIGDQFAVAVVQDRTTQGYAPLVGLFSEDDECFHSDDDREDFHFRSGWGAQRGPLRQGCTNLG